MRCNKCSKTDLVSKLLENGNRQYYCLDCLNVSIVLSEENKKKLDDEKATKRAAFKIITHCQECGSSKFEYLESFDCFGGTGHFRLYHCEECSYTFKQQELPGS